MGQGSNTGTDLRLMVPRAALNDTGAVLHVVPRTIGYVLCRRAAFMCSGGLRRVDRTVCSMAMKVLGPNIWWDIIQGGYGLVHPWKALLVWSKRAAVVNDCCPAVSTGHGHHVVAASTDRVS